MPAPLLTELGDRWLSGQKQQTVNLPALAVYGGSNPPLSTRFETSNSKFQELESRMRHREVRAGAFQLRARSGRE